MKIETERLTLKPLTMRDAESVYENAKHKAISKFIPPIPYPYKLEHAKEFIKITQKENKNNTALHFGVFNTRAKEFIGMIGLSGIKKGLKAEIGYWIGKKYWGNGLATEAIQALTKHGFNKLKLKRIQAHVQTENIASAKLLEKNGFQREGLLRKHEYNKGKLVDSYIYSAINTEWKPLKKPKLNKKTIKEIELARKEIKRGEFVTLDEIIKKVKKEK